MLADLLSWQGQGETLFLRGELDRDTLLPLWHRRESLLSGVRFLDVSGLRRVDSAGVALILQFYYQQCQQGASLTLTGVTDRLLALIALYNLQDVLLCAPRIDV